MTESQKKRDYLRHQIIKQAVEAADRTIMDGSDGSRQETDYLTAEVALFLTRSAFITLGIRTLLVKSEKDPKEDISRKAVKEALKIIAEYPNLSYEETDFLRAEVAKEFVVKALNTLNAKMLEKDLKNYYRGVE